MSRSGWIVGLAAAALAWLGAGCGGGSSAPSAPEPPRQAALREVGEMYRVHANMGKGPPAREKDLATYAPAFSSGSMALVNREVNVFWGATLAPGSESVLAHEKDVPRAGGLVLLGDGETVKRMTAEEFRAAPKAGLNK